MALIKSKQNFQNINSYKSTVSDIFLNHEGARWCQDDFRMSVRLEVIREKSQTEKKPC